MDQADNTAAEGEPASSLAVARTDSTVSPQYTNPYPRGTWGGLSGIASAEWKSHLVDRTRGFTFNCGKDCALIRALAQTRTLVDNSSRYTTVRCTVLLPEVVEQSSTNCLGSDSRECTKPIQVYHR